MSLALLCIMLVPFAAAGLALIHEGLGRSRSAAHAMLATLCVFSISAICFVLVGASFAGNSGGFVHTLHIAGVSWDWLGSGPILHQHDASLRTAFQMLTVGIAALIPVSAGSDRWRLAAICLSTAFTRIYLSLVFTLGLGWWLAGTTWSQFRHRAIFRCWRRRRHPGYRRTLGAIGRVDTGPRRGKYSAEGTPAAIPGHNIVQVLFGCMLALVGWIGLESVSSILFHHLAPEQLALVLINAVLSAGAGCVAAVASTRIRYRKPDASLSANGWIAGLVAGSAAGASVSPVATLFIAAVAGVLVTLMVELFELRLMIDDPGGAISVHAGAGIWGLVAAGVFEQASGTRGAHVLAQLIGVATLLGFMLPLIYALNLLLNRIVPIAWMKTATGRAWMCANWGPGHIPNLWCTRMNFCRADYLWRATRNNRAKIMSGSRAQPA